MLRNFSILSLAFFALSAVTEGIESIGELSLSGLLRNDAAVTSWESGKQSSSGQVNEFNDILETRLVLEVDREDWKYYGDARLYFYQGEAAKTEEGKIQTEEAKVMRSFLRYFSPIGTTTLGKTYINLGNSGVFNPFEIRKLVTYSDLSYAREGILAIEQQIPWQNTSGLQLFAGSHDEFDYDPYWGISPTLHIGSFQLGGVASHIEADQNNSGIFFKGDAFLGINGSYNAVIDDEGNYRYSEAVLGSDYSFYGKWFIQVDYYFNESGAKEPDDYSYDENSYLLGRHYGFASLTWAIDEFMQTSLYAFINAADGSTFIIPQFDYALSSGLTLTLLAAAPTGSGNVEFSQDSAGLATLLVRIEGRF